MNNLSACPACGCRLLAGSKGALCPACMLRAAFSDEPATDSSSPESSCSEQPGAHIGHYQLLEKIGEGGFGIVWMAGQEEPLRRRVALKIIKPGMASREVIARFETERQALALMDHPNIAGIFDAGATETGLPYFVMELVEGVPITRYCDANRLPTRERLELFMDVCHAVQHAHQKGIIHRDLKPSNILVTVKDGRALPKVIDFGIAKATQANLTARTHFTRLNQWLGTPEYMSPEQAGLGGLDVDTRSDIYSLGVLLYELLTGRPPFDSDKLLAAGHDAVMKVIREEEPPKPSTRLGTLVGEELIAVATKRGAEPAKLNRAVRGDLDWIVMKALEKDRRRRYETANGLADDLRRHLDNEVVLARPPGTAYRLKKAWRRHKVGFSAAAMVIAALVLGAVLSTWQALRATRAEALATQRLADAEAISQFLTNAFQSPDPARDGRTITVAEMLDTAAKKLDTELAGQPARRASLQATLGKTYHALGMPREAIPLQEKVLEYFRTTAGPEDPDTLIAVGNLALSYAEAGRRDEAIQLLERVLPLMCSAWEAEHPDTLKALNNLAVCYLSVDRHDEALKLLNRVLDGQRSASGPEHPDTLKAMGNLANSYYLDGQREQATRLFVELFPLMRKVLGPDHPDTLKTMTNWATCHLAAGRKDEAVTLLESGLSLSRKVLGPEHPDTLAAMNNLAVALRAVGRTSEARNLSQEFTDLLAKRPQDALVSRLNAAAGKDDVIAQYNLGLAHATGRLGLSKDAVEAAKWFGKSARQGFALAQLRLGISYHEGFGVEKNEEQAVVWLRRAADQSLAEAEALLGACYSEGDGVPKNEEEAIKWFRKAAGQGDDGSQYNLATSYYHGQGTAKDEREAVRWYLAAAKKNNPNACYSLSICYANGQGVEKDPAESLKWLRKAADLDLAVAQGELGIGYCQGVGVEKNPTEGAKWIRKAAEQNDAKAQCNMGLCYVLGMGVNESKEDAYVWFSLAAAQDIQSARNNLAKLEHMMSPEQLMSARKRVTEMLRKMQPNQRWKPSDP